MENSITFHRSCSFPLEKIEDFFDKTDTFTSSTFRENIQEAQKNHVTHYVVAIAQFKEKSRLSKTDFQYYDGVCFYKKFKNTNQIKLQLGNKDTKIDQINLKSDIKDPNTNQIIKKVHFFCIPLFQFLPNEIEPVSIELNEMKIEPIYHFGGQKLFGFIDGNNYLGISEEEAQNIRTKNPISDKQRRILRSAQFINAADLKQTMDKTKENQKQIKNQTKAGKKNIQIKRLETEYRLWHRLAAVDKDIPEEYLVARESYINNLSEIMVQEVRKLAEPEFLKIVMEKVKDPTLKKQIGIILQLVAQQKRFENSEEPVPVHRKNSFESVNNLNLENLNLGLGKQ